MVVKRFFQQSDDLISQGATLFIDGVWTSTPSHFSRLLPSNLDVETGLFAKATPESAEFAFDSAGRAASTWGTSTVQSRAKILRSIAALINDHADELTHRLIEDMGKVSRDARGEILRASAIFEYFAGEILQPNGSTYPSADPTTLLMTVEQPLGVVCLITPWNFPAAIPAWKIAPALAYGNTVVWKPSEGASGTAVYLTELFDRSGLPRGVVNLLTGPGEALVGSLESNPNVNGISFTGSTSVGHTITSVALRQHLRTQMEMGGKNPAIVLADADLDQAANQICRGAMLATGQRCTATSIAYVEERVLDEFLGRLIPRIQKLRVGDPFDESSDVGPLSSPAQLQSVNSYLELAARENATFLTDRNISLGNCFVSPTVLMDVHADSRLLHEEIFGPVLVVRPVDNFETGLALVNKSQFGLSSAIFTRDIERAFTFVAKAQSGLVHVNRETAGVEPHVPFGGLKSSSNLQREQGTAARAFFTTTKTAYVRISTKE